MSVVYAQPTWQKSAGVPASAAGGSGIGSATEPGRGVPDVAGNADPYSGYQVVVDGQPQPIGGTSAVAPLWAGLIARLAQASGTRFGLLQPLLYAGITPGVDGGRLPRHRRGHQRRLQGRPGLGRLHRSRVTQRDRVAGASLPHHQPHASPDHWSHRPDRSHQRAGFLGLVGLRRRYRGHSRRLVAAIELSDQLLDLALWPTALEALWRCGPLRRTYWRGGPQRHREWSVVAHRANQGHGRGGRGDAGDVGVGDAGEAGGAGGRGTRGARGARGRGRGGRGGGGGWGRRGVGWDAGGERFGGWMGNGVVGRSNGPFEMMILI